jgi:neutral ceramidase
MGHVNIEGTEHRTWPAGLGLSFAAGSTVDGTPRIRLPLLGTVDSIKLREGIVEGELSANERTAQGTIIAALGIHFQKTENTKDYEQGQRPKPLVFSPGLTKPPMAPNALPLQLIKLGSLVVVGIPGEITAMAGRRLRESILQELTDEGITHVALAAYANDYSQYITTAEEYAKQQYEGASTLYGPHTLQAYQQEFLKLARAIKNNQELAPGPRPSKLSANILKRITIRNNSDSTVKVRVYYQRDPLAGGLLDKMAIPQAEFFVPALADYAYVLPNNKFFKFRVNDSSWVEQVRKNKMVLIDENGKGEVTDFLPKFL